MSEIRIENLNKKIKGSVILNDISLTMTPGRIYGLRGKNGCGKTMPSRPAVRRLKIACWEVSQTLGTERKGANT